MPGGSFSSVGARLCPASSHICILPLWFPNLKRDESVLGILPSKNKAQPKMDLEVNPGEMFDS